MRVLWCLVAVALLSVAACEPAPRPTAPAAPTRFTAAIFGFPETEPHRPMVQLGNETREVVLEPETREIAFTTVTVDAAGAATASLDLDAAARVEPTDAFRAAVVPEVWTDDPEELAEQLRDLRFAVARDLGDRWKLERDQAGAATVEIPPGTLEPGRAYRIHLSSVGSIPTELESREVSFGEGDRLGFAFGLSSLPYGRARIAATFRATLVCGNATTILLDESITLRSGETPRWHESEVPVPVAAESCRLALRVTGDAAERVAVWAVPRIRPVLSGTKPNLILISLDTLRADHLSAYGYKRATTPNIDRELVARGTTFDAVSSPYPLTLPAHLSLFTGLYPDVVPHYTVTQEVPVALLAERLRDEGLTTAAFTEGGLMSAQFGLAYGFERFVEKGFSRHGRGAPIFAEGAQFLREHTGEPFFLFLHTYKTHAPYESGPAYEALFVGADETRGGPFANEVPAALRDEVDAYDRTIREVDDQLRIVWDELERLGLADRTFVVLTSDHGEAFGERGMAGHGQDGHEEQLHVPLIVRGPGVTEGQRVSDAVGLIDVMPTILALYGIASAGQADGVSLAAALRGEAVQGFRPLLYSAMGSRRRGLRMGPMKLNQTGPTVTLYDLDEDRRETSDIAARDPAVTRVMQNRLRAMSRDIRERARKNTPAAPPRTIDPELEESLRGLGYID